MSTANTAEIATEDAKQMVVVRLTRSLVPLVMPVQEACYPDHLHEEPDSFVDKVIASPTTSFVCLQAATPLLAGVADTSGERPFPRAPSQTTPQSPTLQVAVDMDPEPLVAMATPTPPPSLPQPPSSSSLSPDALESNTSTAPKAVGYLVTLPAERFQAPALDSDDCPKPSLAEADTLYLHDMAVLPEARGQGVAQTLLALAEQKKEELRLQRMALIAVEGADRYWAKQGFSPVPEEELPAAMQEKLKAYGEGATYMEKTE